LGPSAEKKKGVVDRVWGFFASVKLAVTLFAAIAISSIAGTLIEQQAPPDKNISLLTGIFGPEAAHDIYLALQAAGVTDMYNSWWFTGLLLLFAANIIVCSLDRLPAAWRIIREPIRPLPADSFDSVQAGRRGLIFADPEKAEEMVLAVMKRSGFNGRSEESEGAVQIMAEKGRFGRLGVYVTHLSILLILLGAVVGARFGFKAHVTLLEGMSSDVVTAEDGRDIPLGFDIRCDDFDVVFYPESDRPKTFKSKVTFVEDGRDILTGEIEVNKPFAYKGITFYQANYGFLPNDSALFKFRFQGTGGAPQEIAAKFRRSFELKGSGLIARVVDFSPALALNEEGDLDTYAMAMINPAVLVEFSGPGHVSDRRWILRNYPSTWKIPAGVLEFRDIWGAQYTGLKARKDPGVWLVYLGCALLAAGLCAALFMSHHRLWIRLRPADGCVGIAAASSANRGAPGLDRRLDRLMEEVSARPGQSDGRTA
jgi:cytochrome c biogenesis protein